MSAISILGWSLFIFLMLSSHPAKVFHWKCFTQIDSGNVNISGIYLCAAFNGKTKGI